MARLTILVACGALALGTAAQAQSVSVLPSASSDTKVGDHSIVTHPAGAGDVTDGSRGVHYTSTYSVTGSEISFESGGVSTGDQTLSHSVSRIDMTINNRGDGTLFTTLKSQITPAGMGVFLGDNSAGNCFSSPTSCAQSHGAHTFSELNQLTGAHDIAGVNFDFQIQQDGATLWDLTGGLTISQDGPVLINPSIGQASSALNGFTTLDQFGAINPLTGVSDSALGFAWDATDISQALGPIGGFSSSTISYIVTVDTFSNASCFSDATCLVAYSGFGDPIGRGGDISSAALIFPGNFSLMNQNAPPNFIGGVNFSPETFSTPHFDGNGDLVFAPGGVPEPAAWLSMILGFGVLGSALRRRRVLAYT